MKRQTNQGIRELWTEDHGIREPNCLSQENNEKLVRRQEGKGQTNQGVRDHRNKLTVKSGNQGDREIRKYGVWSS